jgi:cadmium resistance protein CadD (predicted permease)
MDVFFTGTGILILGAVVWVVCAIYAYRNAPKFHRRAWVWGLLGLVLGPIALMIMYVLPKGHQAGASGDGHHDPREDLYEVPHKKR